MWNNVEYRNSKPVKDVLDEILQAIISTEIVLVDSPTGSGKSALVPGEIINDDPKKTIIVAMPTVAAVMSMYKYVRNNLTNRDLVGYACRGEVHYKFGRQRIIYVTTQHAVNVFLKVIAGERALPPDFIFMLDEAHDTNTHTFVALKLALHMKLKMIVSSATPNLSALEGVPVNTISASGRMFPVARHYATTDINLYSENSIIATTIQFLKDMEHLFAKKKGNILVILPGINCIEQIAEELADKYTKTIVTLSSETMSDELNDIFEMAVHGNMLILSTNIAENSITIPNVIVVVDSMVCKVMTNHGGKDVLTMVSASKSSMIQRAGRAGRTCPGIYFALGTKIQWDCAPDHSDQEFENIDPVAYCLQFLAQGLDMVKICGMPQKRHDFIVGYMRKLNLITPENDITDIGHFVTSAQYSVKTSCILYHAKEICQEKPNEILALIMVLAYLEVNDNVFFIPKDMRKKKAGDIKMYKMTQFADFIGDDDLETSFNVVYSMLKRGEKKLSVWCHENKLWDHVMCNIQRAFKHMTQEVFGGPVVIPPRLEWYYIDTHIIYEMMQKVYSTIYVENRTTKIDLKNSLSKKSIFGTFCAARDIVIKSEHGEILLLSQVWKPV